MEAFLAGIRSVRFDDSQGDAEMNQAMTGDDGDFRGRPRAARGASSER